MLEELHIRNLGVIEDAVLTLTPGLTVVSGETGAGKTMVVTALQLLLGARADSGLVRAGEVEATIDARWVPAPPSATEWCEDAGEPGSELIVNRSVPQSGRSRARLNGRMAPASALSDLLGDQVEIHAQHEHHRLARPGVQRDLLDAYAGDGHARTLGLYRTAFRRAAELDEQIESFHSAAMERARELDRCRFELGEIEAIEPDPDADATLDSEIELLANADDVRRGLQAVLATIGDGGVVDAAAQAAEDLARLPLPEEQARSLSELFETATASLAEAASVARALADRADSDPDRLDMLQRRRHDLRQLERKYGPELADVIAYAETARATIETLEGGDDHLVELKRLRAELEDELATLGTDITRGRTTAAGVLAREVNGHLADLAMPAAAFSIEVSPASPSVHGRDRVAFMLAANPGEPPAELANAASGGERSRVALAIEVALADIDQAEILVFDEVDAGVGGRTAMAVGQKLARLAAGGQRQVLCVTHLAQLAAFADVHHVVEKGIRGGRTVTTSRRLGTDERAAELARMLGGDPSEVGQAHAQELLDEAVRRRAS